MSWIFIGVPFLKEPEETNRSFKSSKRKMGKTYKRS